MADVFLDLWGVLTDSRKMKPAYRTRIADILHARYGGPVNAWLRAHDAAHAWYSEHMDRPDTWVQGSWLDVVNRAETENIARMFQEAGVPPSGDALETAKAIEFEVMAGVDAAFPDARPAVARLKAGGHRVFVSTGAMESNARGSLTGARLLQEVHGVFTGELLNAGKDGSQYWKGVLERVKTEAMRAFVVDDRLDYLEAAASVGFRGLLMDRDSRHPPEAMPSFVEATLKNLAGLPRLLATAGPVRA